MYLPHIPFPILVEIDGLSTASPLRDPAALERIHVPEIASELNLPHSVLPVVYRFHLLTECPRDSSAAERFAVYSYTAEASEGVAISEMPGGHVFFLEGAYAELWTELIDGLSSARLAELCRMLVETYDTAQQTVGDRNQRVCLLRPKS